MRDLVVRAMSGERDAFRAIIDRRGDALHGIALRIVRDPDRAADALQRTFIQLWRELPRLRDPDRFEAWSHRILVNACRRELRGAGRWAAPLDLAPPPAVPDTAASVADRDALERAFRVLSVEQRAIVVLHHMRGLSLVEIARTLGIPPGTAYSRLHYAHRRLRSALERAEATTPERGLA